MIFAYGSNANLADLDRWCAERGYGTGLFEKAGTGFLPDRELAFTRWSRARQGGVLDARPRRGAITHGVILRARSEAGLRALDQKEGHPEHYRRFQTVALGVDGSAHLVWSYEVVAPKPFVEPTSDYLATVERGYRAFEIEADQLHRAARGHRDTVPGNLFVYGSLMRDQDAHARLSRFAPRSLAAATVTAALYDHGPYPSLVVDPGATAHGEVASFDQVEHVLADTDRYEGFDGFDATGNLYERRLIEARVGDAPVRAWIYVKGTLEGGTRVEGGCWSAHRRG
jgi:gamma-glutamylcyclotransferase (GGCT)/AIG2-like uncharacterized protein YtfP